MDFAGCDDRELPPAARLVGLELASGWRVLERVERLDGQTGGSFSVGYLAKREEDGSIAFLKALDFSRALQEENQLEAIAKSVEAFRFEQDLLNICEKKRMTKVVRALDSGYARVDNSQLGRVPYLLFEPADGDIRKTIIGFDEIKVSWIFGILHEVALGLEQLHYAQVAHQDLKPSSVLSFLRDDSFKISDLGCASRKELGGPRDGLRVAGGWSVAPPELAYGEKSDDWVVARVAADLYSLGSLIVFLFSGASMNAIVRSFIPEEMQALTWRGTYREVLPFVVDAYSRAFEEIAQSLEGRHADETMKTVRQLCEPDPLRRGDPRWIGKSNQQYDVRRYVSRLGSLRRRAQYEMKTVTKK